MGGFVLCFFSSSFVPPFPFPLRALALSKALVS